MKKLQLILALVWPAAFLSWLSPARAVDVNGLVAHWKFDEGGGTIAYDSAGDNHGTICGAQWTTGQNDGVDAESILTEN